MFKKASLIFAYALAALFSNALGQGFIELDVIIRDFPVGYAGFEEFDAEKRNNGKCTEKNDARESKWTPENRICFKGNSYIPCSEGGEQLGYGRDPDGKNHKNSNGESWRGYCNGPDRTTECKCNANGTRVDNGDCDWANPVGVTKGMVLDKLDYSQCSDDEKKGDTDIERAINGRYCARPQKGNGDCYGDGVSEWFTDGGKAKRFEDVIRLKEVGGAFYEINYDYNTKTEWRPGSNLYDNGYFPVDKYEDSWGFQSLNVWCPKDKNAAGITYDLGANCDKWNAAGGGKDPDAAQKAVKNGVPERLLHNYGFSMAGSGEFKFDKSKNEEFQFIGDDDMWIFIDGELFVDLGGTHLAAPAKINITDYGKSKDWPDGSQHAINFYYLDRQTDGSNMKLRISISNLSPSRFGAPRIVKAETVLNPDGTTTTKIYVSNTLANLKDFEGKGEYPILIKKPGSNELLAFRLDEVVGDPINKGSQGYMYTIKGEVCKSKNECGGSLLLNSGDSLSFNVLDGQDVEDGGFSNPNHLGLSDESWYIKSTNQTPATTKSWAINTTNLPPIEFKPNVPDQTPVKPPFAIKPGEGSAGDDNGVPGGSGGSAGKFDGEGKFWGINQVWDAENGKMISVTDKNNDVVHGFGTVGKPIPPQRTGELILTVYPSTKDPGYAEWLKDLNNPESDVYKYFGLPPMADGDNWWGLANPKEEAEYDGNKIGGYRFVKNGFPNESNVKGNIKISPTRCTTKPGTDGKPRINCLNFSLKAQQPFQLAVTVYDQLGNFVTQYRETLNEQEFRNVVQAPNYIDDYKLVNKSGASTGCEVPTKDNYGAPTTLTTNGQINVGVNIYPFSSDGRRFGNGVYIVKIDRVDLPFKDGEKNPDTGNGYTCASAGSGNSARISPIFIRYHADMKFGWMRTTSSD